MINSSDEERATPQETRQYLLERSNREFAPLLKAFVQNPDKQAADRSAPLATFVRNGDLRGLQALLFLHAIISSGDSDAGWSTTLPLGAWARAFGITETTTAPKTATTATSKLLRRLEERQMITKTHARRKEVTVTLLQPDGHGQPYTHPGHKESPARYLKLHNNYWSEGWHAKLNLAATAMLLVALHEKDSFSLATEHMDSWYGFSPDTAERGFASLREHGLITVKERWKKAPLSPTGSTRVNIYSLTETFRTAPPKTPTNTHPSLSELFGNSGEETKHG